MSKKIAITLTTINLPVIVEKLISQEVSLIDYLEIIIIGDLKTPLNTKEYLSNLPLHKPNVVVRYMDVAEQQERFEKYKKLWNHLPLNSFSRRNFADLYCLSERFDYVIRIDDDNFPISDHFILDHINALELKEVEVYSCSSGWFNICELLIEKKGKEFYPRGFPYPYRNLQSNSVKAISKVKVGINAGLWLGDPDVDAITRLSIRPVATAINDSAFTNSIALETGTWSPINTQNTSYRAELLQISFVSPHVGRYDDIFCGYIARSILDKLEIKSTYGIPVVFQDRNIHDLWNDEKLERFGNTDGVQIIDFLKEYEYTNVSLLGCYEEIARELDKEFSDKYEEIKQMCLGINCWISAVEKVV